MKNKKRKYTIMFIPDDNGKTFYFTVTSLFLRSFVFLVFVFVVSLVFFSIYWGEITIRLQYVKNYIVNNEKLKKENKILKESLNNFEYVTKSENFFINYVESIGLQGTGISIPFNVSGLSKSNSEKTTAYDTSYTVNNFDNSTNIPNISPVDGWITKKYINNTTGDIKKNHYGVDYAADEGTPIRATASGVISSVNDEKYLGKIVSVDHKNGYVTRYGHCKQILVHKGNVVKKGQTIAIVGNTGKSSAPHVHYEVLKNGKNVDPLGFVFNRLE